MGINFEKYYKMLGDEKITYIGGALPQQVVYGFTNMHMFQDCKNILDVGCGNRAWSKILQEMDYNVWSTDINHTCDYVIVDDMHNSQLKNKTFDGIFCNGVFEHSLSPFIMLCEMNRILKVGGEVFINMPDAENKLMSELPQHINLHTYHSAKNLFDKTNFEIKEFAKFYDHENGMHLIFLLKKKGDLE